LFIPRDLTKETAGLTEVFTVRNENVKPIVMRWNHSVSGLLAIGCNNGTCFLFNTKQKSHKILPASDDKKNPSVIDMQWDRLSISYLLVAYENHLVLWDT
jgi:hypothetical protein